MIENVRKGLTSYAHIGVRVTRLTSVLMTLLIGGGSFPYNAIAQQADTNGDEGWKKELFSDPEFISRYNALSDDGHEFFRNLSQLLPHLMWRPQGTTEVPRLKKRRESIELLAILDPETVAAEAELRIASEIKTTSTFISEHKGPETVVSKSLPNSNYWIAFTKFRPVVDQQLRRLISAKFFGDDAAKTDSWLQTQGSKACIDFIGIDDSSTIRQGITLIDASATLDQQLACLRQGYYLQIGVTYDISADGFRDKSRENLTAQTVYDGRLLEVFYDKAYTPGMPATVAYPILVKHVLALAESYVP